MRPCWRQSAETRAGAMRSEQIGWTSHGRAGLVDVVLQEPCVYQRAAHGQLIVARESGGPEDRGKVLNRLGALSSLESGQSSDHGRLDVRAQHASSIARMARIRRRVAGHV
jgi:hypothetical protein